MNSPPALHVWFDSKISILTAFAAVVMISIGCANNDKSAIGLDLAAYSLVDLTHAFNAETIFWPTDQDGFVLETVSKGISDGGYYYEASKLRTAEHGGTHLDAPIHFAEAGNTADEIALERLIAQAVVVDISDQSSDQSDYEATIADVQAFEATHGKIAASSILLFRTGYSTYWSDRAQYLGTPKTGPEAIPELHFPGIGPELAEWLVSERDIASVGIDTPSLDRGQSADFLTHRILFAQNIPGFENVANLDRLPPTGSFVFALPMKIEGGSGGPLRIVAMVPKSSSGGAN